MALSAEQSEQLANDLSAYRTKLYAIVHGGATETVETDGGTVKTVAKVIADADALLAAHGVDLAAAMDTVEGYKDEAEAIRDSLVNVVELKGEFDASTGSFPADPDIGDYWIVTTGGTVSATVLVAGDEIIYGPSGWIIVGRNLSAGEILTLLLTADGAGSGLDADKLDGQEGSYYATAAALAAKADASAVTAGLNDKMDDPDTNGLVLRTGANGAASAVIYSDWGVWTPTVVAATPGDLSVSYAGVRGTWARIGNLVFMRWSLTFTPTFTTATGRLDIAGHPIAPPSSGDPAGNYIGAVNIVGSGNNGPNWGSGTQMSALISGSAFVFQSSASAAQARNLSITDFVSGNSYNCNGFIAFGV